MIKCVLLSFKSVDLSSIPCSSDIMCVLIFSQISKRCVAIWLIRLSGISTYHFGTNKTLNVAINKRRAVTSFASDDSVRILSITLSEQDSDIWYCAITDSTSCTIITVSSLALLTTNDVITSCKIVSQIFGNILDRFSC